MMPHIITQILALIISGLHLLFIRMPSDSSWRDSDYGLVGASYNCSWIHKVTATPSKQFRLGI